MSDAVAVVLFLGITAYAVFGGADFGAGIWDLLAGGARRGERPREIIDHSIGPVWEANHVWLIFTFVVLWTGFPEAYASITLTLFVPLTIAAVGIVLRGSSFAFRKAVFRNRDRRNFGAAFAIASLLVPFCFGAVAGGIASGEVPAGGKAGDPWHSWLNPTSILGGVLAVVAVAFLSSVFLVWDAARLNDDTMVDYFRRRTIISAVLAGAIALGGLFVLRSDARYLFDGLTSRGLPLVIISALCGTGSLVLLVRAPTPRRSTPRHRRRRRHHRRVGSRPMGLPPPHLPHRLRRRRTIRHPHHHPGRDHHRRHHHLPLPRALVHPRPTRPPPRRRRRRHHTHRSRP